MRISNINFAPAPTLKQPRRRPIWLLASLLGLLTVVLYWPAVHNDFVNFDDDIYVTANPHVQAGLTAANIPWAFTHQVNANWHPLTLLSHMLDCQLYGLSPWGHHLTSLLLHAGNAVLVFLVLWRLTGAQGRSFWVALFFACHPVHVESVAWVAERKDVLSGSFGLLALLFYAEFGRRQRTGNPAPAFYRCPYYWLAWFSFALGLMCKPMLVTWPFVLLLLDYWPLARFQPGRWRALVVEKIPFLALTLTACLITYMVQQQAGAMTMQEFLPLGPRSANALVSYGRYVGQWFWPVELACFYPHPGHWAAGWVLLASAGLLGVSAWGWRQRARQPYFLMGWLWFVGTLVPVIGLVQVGSQAMADRYNYLPSIGLSVLIVWMIHELVQAGRLNRTLALAAGTAAAILCASLTVRQIGYWQNSETVFRHALDVVKTSEIIRNNLGAALLDRGETAAAIKEFETAIQLRPQSALIHTSLGSALFKTGKREAAIREFETAVRLEPNYAEAYNNLGIALSEQGQTNAAIVQLQKAIQIKPDYAEAYNNLGLVLFGHTQASNVISQFQKAIEIKPNYAQAYYNLGDVLTKISDKEGAIRAFQAASQLRPDDIEIHYKLGNLLAEKGQSTAAIEQFKAALRLQPDFAEAHANLACQLPLPDQADAAISHFKEAIRIKPEYTEAHYNLGNVYLKIKRPDLAAVQYQAALKLQPDMVSAHYYLGVALSRQGQLDAAIEQFQATLKLQPNHAGATKSLARALEVKAAPANSPAPGSE